MGVLSAVVTAPFLLVGLFAGVWVDRWRRRPVLISGDVGRALVLSAIPIARVAGALYILFVTRELGMKPVAIGAVFSLGSLGALAGVLLAGSLARRLGIGRVIVATPLISGLGFVPVVPATPALAVPLLTLGALASSFGYPIYNIYNISQVSLRQAITPHRLQGRMNATMRFLVWGTMPLGALAGAGAQADSRATRAGGLARFAATALGDVPDPGHVGEVCILAPQGCV